MSLHFEILANKGHRFFFNRLVDTLPVKRPCIKLLIYEFQYSYFKNNFTSLVISFDCVTIFIRI